MRIWTLSEEAEHLAERFRGVPNRKEFATDNSIPGGDAMVYQHITAKRPIGREAAIAYAKAFGCGLEEISPRIALEVMAAAALVGNSKVVNDVAHESTSEKSQKLSPESRALITAIIDADNNGLGAEAFKVLRQTLRLFRGDDQQRLVRGGIEDADH
ncbi:hypothetical protein [Burkholderia glumae]|uniref:Uncharacterized protein n=1 Tax=Burkholderia glumae TaxID=337 RepID=A0AAP9XX08_BURGL|nr:hypothetical protein [Burkholderia glumae]MCM2541166.1 hypothetical protein [Burkholderia glumae]MCM2550492.1 hypothetical protein [Burkholderia glumae]QPQ90276.1 hypothetical protein I6H06_00365 [Burkholderia glumae]QQM94106.1 hypothetical protein I6G78_20105 [Burkholderia glumae]USS43707.1 hypothetical protein NFI99_04455 [Burkholderia glumae]